MNNEEVQVYGANWCEDTRHTLEHLNDLGIDYRYVNIDADPAGKEWVLEQNDGRQKTPTVSVGRFVLSVPSDGELDTALRAAQVLGN